MAKDMTELNAEGRVFVGLLSYQEAVFATEGGRGEAEVWKVQRKDYTTSVYTYDHTVPLAEVKTFDDLCSEEEARAKLKRERCADHSLRVVWEWRTPNFGKRPYKVRRWGAFNPEGQLVATIHVRGDGRLRWSPYPLGWFTE